MIGDSIVNWAGLTQVQLAGGGVVYWRGVRGARFAGVANRIAGYLQERD